MRGRIRHWCQLWALPVGLILMSVAVNLLFGTGLAFWVGFIVGALAMFGFLYGQLRRAVAVAERADATSRALREDENALFILKIVPDKHGGHLVAFHQTAALTPASSAAILRDAADRLDAHDRAVKAKMN